MHVGLQLLMAMLLRQQQFVLLISNVCIPHLKHIIQLTELDLLLLAALLLFLQQQLQPNTVQALRKAVPALTDADVAAMMRAPMRSYDPTIMQVRPAASSTQRVTSAAGSKQHPASM
jgi:hypothetical protein